MSFNYSTDRAFEFDDFKDGELVEKLCGFSFEDEAEIELEINASVNEYRPARTYSIETASPAEGGDCEDITALFYKEDKSTIDLYDHLTDNVKKDIEETLYEEAITHEQDMKDAAMEARADEMRERRLFGDEW